MKALPKLPNGLTYGMDSAGKRICTGSQMGRPNRLPEDRELDCKLRMVRLEWFGGDYDSGGAYWGNTGANSIYRVVSTEPHAFGDSLQLIEVFVRASTREDAKALVREFLPYARFFN